MTPRGTGLVTPPERLDMAADLAGTPSTGVRMQVCGDCHLLNFGAFAMPERQEIFDRSVDQVKSPGWP